MNSSEKSAIATLFPGYFALVMATGIVSLAAHFHGHHPLSLVLLGLNALMYLVLWILTFARLIKYRPLLFADLTSHSKGVTFLTMVAGTCVLGTQFAILTSYTGIAEVL